MVEKKMLEGFVPWPEELARIYKEKGYWEDVTLGEHFDRWVAQYGDRPALACKGEVTTYRQMGERVTRLAYGLAKMGLKTYDRVILQLPNGPELVYLFYACLKIGAIPIASLPAHRWAEITHFAKLAEARVHAVPAGKVKDFDFEEFADQVRAEAPNVRFVLTAGKPERPNHVSINDLIETVVDLDVAKKELGAYRPDPMQPAVFQLSGGTTGVPKIVPRTHNDYYYNAKCEAVVEEFNTDTRCVVVTPLTHNLPMICGLLPLHLAGSLLVLSASTAPAAIFKAIAENKADKMILVPALMHHMLDAPPEERSKYDLSSFKWLLWGANFAPADVQIAFRDVFHCDTQQIYGMAEGLVCWTRVSDPLDTKLNTCGRPISEADEVRVTDVITGEEMPAGQVGENWTRGPYTVRGYYQAPEHNKNAFSPDGYYRTGDLIRKDANGNVIVAGRLKDLISRGSERINAEEVEEHIMKFPKVANAALVAMPDKVLEERACVFVVPKPGQTFTLEELNNFLLTERKIAKFKCPERLEFIDELPLTKVGKFEKKTLREKVAAMMEAEGKI